MTLTKPEEGRSRLFALPVSLLLIFPFEKPALVFNRHQLHFSFHTSSCWSCIKFPFDPGLAFACWNACNVWRKSVFYSLPRSSGGLAELQGGRGAFKEALPPRFSCSAHLCVPAERLWAVKGCQSTAGAHFPPTFSVDQYILRTVTACNLMTKSSKHRIVYVPIQFQNRSNLLGMLGHTFSLMSCTCFRKNWYPTISPLLSLLW